MNNKFALFYGICFYPGGGMWDYKGSFQSIKEAEASFREVEEEKRLAWFHVVDVSTMKVVLAEGVSCRGDSEDFEENENP